MDERFRPSVSGTEQRREQHGVTCARRTVLHLQHADAGADLLRDAERHPDVLSSPSATRITPTPTLRNLAAGNARRGAGGAAHRREFCRGARFPRRRTVVCICVALCRKLGNSVIEDAVGAEAYTARKRAGIVVAEASEAELAPWSGQMGAIQSAKPRKARPRGGRHPSFRSTASCQTLLLLRR